ncbi:hypothetical protein IE077_002807 [Cardiosporidium cionae]|uniref:C2 domain-containing protein n=1 Tax=Cardiosporidium cionae TaxID=476202 RepID=A0ABQ7JA00_9APIC|nr:hypothetical protein IE077_002807 [Cardiosporidium cionae]|eukprot:KAF8820801.1 hypothetical protein IE077_002807 [Cardiosporidium cionae]
MEKGFDKENIASMTIDLEDYWFNYSRRTSSKIIHSSFEHHTLQSSTTGNPFGEILLRVDMFPMESVAELPPANTCSVEVPVEAEIRLVIWKCEGIPYSKDALLGIFLQCELESESYFGCNKKQQVTDTQHIDEDGNAEFNWRVVYPRNSLPVEFCSVQMRLMRKSLLADDTCLGELTLHLDSGLSLLEKTLERQSTDLEIPFVTGNIGTLTKQCTLRMTLDLLTQSEADSYTVGIARNDPNRDPFLTFPANNNTHLGNWNITLYGFSTKVKLALRKGILVAAVIIVALFFLKTLHLNPLQSRKNTLPRGSALAIKTYFEPFLFSSFYGKGLNCMHYSE